MLLILPKRDIVWLQDTFIDVRSRPEIVARMGRIPSASATRPRSLLEKVHHTYTHTSRSLAHRSERQGRRWRGGDREST